MPNFDIRKMVVGMLVVHEGKYLVLQRDEELENICITYLAARKEVDPVKMLTLINMVITRLKDEPTAPPKEEEKS